MPIDEAEALHDLMVKFENNPQDPKNAFLYFQALNRHGMFLTVVRLYNKHNLKALESETNNNAKFMKNEFEFAIDNLR